MALNEYTLSLLAQIEFQSVLSLGYPDIVIPAEQLEQITGICVEQCSSKASAWHGKRFALPDTKEFFAKRQTQFICVDFKSHRGDEIVADLNFPHDFGQFDLVIDPGTIEHCFNVAQAAMTAARSVKVGGYILHVNPISMVNHGFYNLSPTWYYDFYGDNGFHVLKCFGVSKMEGKTQEFDLPAKARVAVPSEASAYVLAQRVVGGELQFPIQAKYRG